MNKNPKKLHDTAAPSYALHQLLCKMKQPPDRCLSFHNPAAEEYISKSTSLFPPPFPSLQVPAPLTQSRVLLSSNSLSREKAAGGIPNAASDLV